MAERTLRARLEAETSQFSARMAAAEGQLARMERAPIVAARGMGQLQSGMRVLAFQATGLTGPLGAVATSLGSLALGGPLMLAVMAGLGAGALAVKVFGDEVEEFGRKTHAIALDKAISSIHAAALKLNETPLDRLQANLDRTNLAIQELERISAVLILPEEEKQLNQLLADRLVFEKAITEEKAKQADAIRKAQFEAKELRIELVAAVQAMTAAIPSPRLQLLNQFGGGALRGVTPQVADIDRPERALALRRIANESMGIELNRVSLDLKRKEHVALIAGTAAVQWFADATELASLRTQQAAASLISGIGVLIQGQIAGGGSVGGFLGGALGLVGGIVGMANPILGAVLTAGGGIIATIAAKSRREPIPVRDIGTHSAIDSLHRKIEALEARRPKQITVQILDASGRPVRDTIARIRREGALGGELLLPAGI